jgi:hypothetical protein
MILMRKVLVFLLFCFLTGALSLGALAKELVIYLDPQGSDTADGLSAERPVASLQKAVRIAELVVDKEVSRIRIRIASGEYKRQAAKARGSIGGREIGLIAADSTQLRPRFDGDGRGGTWFDLKSASGKPSHYTIAGLEIINYATAINFAGDRNSTELFNGENEVRDNLFTNIGEIARVGSLPSTAVIRLVNSDHNVIKGNHFFHIKNTARCALLHSVYVAHDSTANVIEGNVFEDTCGDAVRFRDGSHSNLVKDNTFIDAWDKAPVSDWYCDRERRSDCTKKSGECPSMNNVLENNTVVARNLKSVQSFLTYGNDRHADCQNDLEGKRFVINDGGSKQLR